MKINFEEWYMCVYPDINPEKPPMMAWFVGIWDAEDDRMLYRGDPRDNKNQALVERMEILERWYMPCDYGCGEVSDEETDCTNCDYRHTFDEFRKKVMEEMDK